MAQPTQWKRPFLVWSEAVRDLRLPTQREAIDLRHLGSMWVLDAEKKGKVSEKNVEDFSRRCSERLHDFPPSEFADITQASFALEMWESVRKPGGRKKLISWMMRLLVEESKISIEEEAAKMKKEDFEDSCDSLLTENMRHELVSLVQQSPDEYLDISAAQVLHKMLGIHERNGLDLQEFLHMLQEVGDELGQDLHDERLDYLVTAGALECFLERFVDGLADFMSDVILP